MSGKSITCSFGFYYPNKKDFFTATTDQPLSFFEGLICIGVLAFEEDIDLQFYINYNGDRVDCDKSSELIVAKLKDYEAKKPRNNDRIVIAIGKSEYTIVFLDAYFRKAIIWICQQLGFKYKLLSGSPKERKEPQL